ncbi:hypothetical protein ACFLU6_08115, partial [Acidobacteriota bacterium]
DDLTWAVREGSISSHDEKTVIGQENGAMLSPGHQRHNAGCKALRGGVIDFVREAGKRHIIPEAQA